MGLAGARWVRRVMLAQLAFRWADWQMKKNPSEGVETDGNSTGNTIRDYILLAWCMGCFAYFYGTHGFVELIANLIKGQ